MKLWERPEHYMGETFYDYYVVLGQHRDSDSLDRSNFETALKMLGGEGEHVIVARATHWAVGWVETIMIHRDASEEILLIGEEIQESLEDYPVLDEDHWSQLEYDEVYEYWDRAPLWERVRLCSDAGISIFATRHDDAPSQYDRLWEYLRD